MAQVSRNHHYITSGYLGGFTDTGKQDGVLNVADLSAGRWFQQIPRRVAYERDFNRIRTEGYAPDAVETALGRFEEKALNVIRRITSDVDLPENEDFSYVLNLITLFAVRSPALRRAMAVARQHVYRIIEDLLASDRRVYEAENRRARAAGFLSDVEVPFEDFRKSVRREGYTLELGTEDHLSRELEVFQKLLPEVSSRYWSLLIAAPGAPDFVTCDHPVSLVYKQLLFPLDARHALMGDRQPQAPRKFDLVAEGVAEVNSRMLKLANRQIYSRAPDIALLRNGKILTTSLAELASSMSHS